MVLKRTVVLLRCEGWLAGSYSLLAGGVLGDGLGALADGVLGQLSWQQQSDGCLDLPEK